MPAMHASGSPNRGLSFARVVPGNRSHGERLQETG